MNPETSTHCQEVTGSFLVTRRRTDDPRFAVAESLNLIWAPEGGAIRIGGGHWHKMVASDYAITAPGVLIELTPPRHGDGRINILGVSPAMVRDISEELKTVSRSGLRGLSSPRLVAATMPTGVAEQPSWLTALLRDLDQAASLGLQDTGWLRRHVRLVWERLVFSRLLDRKRSPRRPARPRTARNYGVLTARLGKVRRMLEEHYDQPINLEEMAASACVSRYHFLREFRKKFGKTPYQPLLKIRLEAARRMIEKESTPINEISRRVGFASPDGFYRAFRKRFSRSPSECRLVAC